MAQDDDLAVAALHADIFDRAVAGGLDPGAGRCAVVDALVRPPFLQHGVEARRTEARGDARELERRAQEGLADILAVGRVIAAAVLTAGRIGEPCGAVGLAVVDELGGEDAPGAHRAAQMIDGFVDDGEAVALAQIAMKIDVAAENVRQLRRHRVRNSRGVRCPEQGKADLGRFHEDLGFERQGLLRGGKPLALVSGLAFDHQGLILAAVEREYQGLQFALWPGPRRQVLARAELAKQALRRRAALQKADRGRIIDAEALQQRHHRVAALYPFFAQEALFAVCRCGERGQGQDFDHLLLRDVRQADVVDRTKGGDHAEERHAHHACAGPEMRACRARNSHPFMARRAGIPWDKGRAGEGMG